MTGVLEAVTQNPYTALRLILGDPLHPGGQAATEDLLDRAQVGAGTHLVDLGCGAGGAIELARARGATAIGVDHQARAGQICGTLEDLPLAGDSVDVALSECTICLADDVPAAVAECHRILRPDGRLALSDVTLEHPLDHVPEPLAKALCLTGQRRLEDLVGHLEAAGFGVTSQQDHREDLLAMRDRLRGRVDVEGLLIALGARGARLQRAVDEIEQALEEGTLGYVSLVASKDG